MKQMHFNYKDIFRSARLAFSLQRIWLNGLGLLAGYVIFLIISYVSLLVGGYSFSVIWNKFGLLPCAFALAAPWYSVVLYIIALIAFCAVILLTNTAVSRVVYMTLRDELFYTWTQALKFAWKKWVSSLGAMLTFLFIIAFFVIGALVMAFIGRIPFIGEIGTALFTIPYIFAALLLFFICLAFGVALFFVPAILATSDEDALGGVFQSFSITFNQPWRILIYVALLGVLYILGFFLFGLAMKFSYHIFMTLFTMGMGEKMVHIQQQALHVLDRALPAVFSWAHSLPFNLGGLLYLNNPHPIVASMPVSVVISGYILGISLLFLAGVVIAYAEAIGNAGLTIIYVILYKLQEKESLLEREDEELKKEEEEEKKEEKPAPPKRKKRNQPRNRKSPLKRKILKRKNHNGLFVNPFFNHFQKRVIGNRFHPFFLL